MSAHAQQERQALADLLVEVGPDAPTLCAGWRARDLAAHLVVRERRPDAVPGVVVPALAGYLDRVQRSVRDGRSWQALVETVRNGPPLLLRPLDEPVNTVEYFVHHEDVRRAAPAWEPRSLPEGLEKVLWSRVRWLGRLAGRKVRTGLVLDAPGHGRLTVRAGEPSATVTGAPGELVLFLFGRKDAARVAVTGDEAAIAKVREADLGM